MLRQLRLFAVEHSEPPVSDADCSTFVNNMKLPVHRWFRYSAGFSARWVESVIRSQKYPVRVFDPFAGSATTLIAAENVGVQSFGIDSHPFVAKIAKAKLHWRASSSDFLKKIKEIKQIAKRLKADTSHYPPLIHKCYGAESLAELDVLRRATEKARDNSPAFELAWLVLVIILRKVSTAGTAQWQYILPKKQKRSPMAAMLAYDECAAMIADDMEFGQRSTGPKAEFLQTDARTCEGVPTGYANLVITSPPYPNNYDYADATRLEMSFLGEINGWGGLQTNVRQHLIRSCTQHVPERTIDLPEIMATSELRAIRSELEEVCSKLAVIRKTKGGKKNYHLMVACYFRDLALVWKSLRRVCSSPSRLCFVIGDSAPYGIYVPVVPWLTKLAVSAGFQEDCFEKTRDRNVKWKNRKHRVPLLEGRLWVNG